MGSRVVPRAARVREGHTEPGTQWCPADTSGMNDNLHGDSKQARDLEETGTPQLSPAVAAKPQALGLSAESLGPVTAGPTGRGQGPPAHRPPGPFSSPTKAQCSAAPGLNAVSACPPGQTPFGQCFGPGKLWQLPLGLSGQGLSWSTVGAVILCALCRSLGGFTQPFMPTDHP